MLKLNMIQVIIMEQLLHNPTTFILFGIDLLFVVTIHVLKDMNKEKSY